MGFTNKVRSAWVGKMTVAMEEVVKAEGHQSVSQDDRAHLARVLINNGRDEMLKELKGIRRNG